MGLDVRLPIGWLFLALGLLLIGYGLLSEPAIYQHSLGININLIWGSVLLGFGLLMLILAQRAKRKLRDEAVESGADFGPEPFSSSEHKK